MDTPIQSTFRRLTATFLLSGTCAALAACSNQNQKDWFHFGKDTPQINTPQEVETQPEDSQPTEPISTIPFDSPEPEPSTQPDLQADTAPPQDQPETNPDPDVAEIVQLYRRLHVEMDQNARSQLLVELLSDNRERVRLLGFELASRDLSSGATLSAQAANAAVTLLGDPLPSVRIGAARLITRLALPDAMSLLTTTLASEQDPLVAESLLRGLERWPNKDARDDVLRWYQSSGPTRAAAASAAWGLVDLNLLDLDTHASILRIVYRTIPDNNLTDADMRLIASTGTAADIDRLITLARDHDSPTRSNAAAALIHSPRGVDPLIALAMNDPAFSPHAAAAIETHRLNPDGIHRLAALPWTDDQARTDTLIRACDRLDHDQLSIAVRLARSDHTITDDLSIRLLNRLVAGAQIVSPRSAPGIVLLAQLELNNQRPDRTLEILSLLPDSGIDPASTLKATRTKATAHILLAEFEQAAALDLSADTWIAALQSSQDQPTTLKIAQEILARSIQLTPDQQNLITPLIDTAPEPPANDPAHSTPDQP